MIGVLFYLVLGYGQAKFQSIGSHIRQLDANILVSRSQIVSGTQRVRRSLEYGAINTVPLDIGSINNIWLHSNVTSVEPYWSGRLYPARIKIHGKHTVGLIQFMSMSLESQSFPKYLSDNIRTVLSTPGYFAVSKPLADKLNIRLGDQVDFITVFDSHAEATAKVGGILDEPHIISEFALMSDETASRMNMNYKFAPPSLYLIRVKDKSKLEQTIAELSVMLKPYGLQATTPADKVFIENMEVILAEQKGLIMIVGAMLFIICVIAGFIMRGAILSYRLEFGTLQALGVSKWQISKVAMEQAFWLGVFSVAVSFCGALVFKYVFETMGIYLTYPSWVLVGVPATLMGITLFAGLLSLSAITKIKPVELMR